MAPREYEAAMIPLIGPWGSSKSVSISGDIHIDLGIYTDRYPLSNCDFRGLTFNPRGHDLQGIDKLRVEARRQLDTHTSREEKEIQQA